MIASLQSYFEERFPVSWQYALKAVRADYPQTDFPEEWQFSHEVEDLLAAAFWLELPEKNRSRSALNPMG